MSGHLMNFIEQLVEKMAIDICHMDRLASFSPLNVALHDERLTENNWRRINLI